MNKVMDMYHDLGWKMKSYRKSLNFTLKDVSVALNKSVANISKYESGNIAIPLDILIDFCRFINVDINYFLPNTTDATKPDTERHSMAFIDKAWVYWYKRTDNKIHVSAIECDNITGNAAFYFDINDDKNIYNCDYIYHGTVTYSDFNVNLFMQNIATPHDILTLSIPTISEEGDYKLALNTSINFRFQNVAIKQLVSRMPISDKEWLKQKLVISENDIANLRNTNFFTIT